MEQVLCLAKNDLPPEWTMREVSLSLREEDLKFIQNEMIRWIPRRRAELSRSLKQIIPYVLTIDTRTGMFACYPRQGSENRLHGLWSLGIGGHIDINDEAGTFLTTIQQGLKRELEEEFLDFALNSDDLEFKGIVNEERTAVGRVHVGLVYVLRTDGRITPGKELAGMRWVSNSELLNYKLEFWSELAMDLCGEG